MNMLGLRLLGQEGCPVHCRVLSSIPGLNPCQKLSPLPSCKNQKHLQTLPKVPRRTKWPPVELLTYKITFSVYTVWLETCTASPDPESWAALLIYPSLPGALPAWSSVVMIMGPRLGEKNSSLFWSWHIETNPAKWFQHYFVVWVQFRGNMRGSTKHLSHVRASSHLSHKNQTTEYPFKKKKKVFSKANFQSVFENYIPPRWKTYIFILFRISTVNSWLSSFQGRPPLHLLALFLIFHLSFIYLTEFDRKFSER